MSQNTNEHKSQLQALCEKLLRDAAAAEKAAEKVLAKLEKTSEYQSADAGEKQKLEVQYAARCCKSVLVKENPDAFAEIITLGMFSDEFAFHEIKDGDDEGCFDYIISRLSNRQRFIFVLKTECGLDNTEIAKTLKLKETDVEKELVAAKSSMLRILDSLQKDREEEVPTYQRAKAKINEMLDDVELPKPVVQGDLRVAMKVAEPVKTKKKSSGKKKNKKQVPQKKRLITILAACAAVVICVAGLAISLFGSADYKISHYADIEIEDYGTITVALSEDVAPITVENFVSLAESGFYDGLTFHRIIEGFMMQGGDPNGDGTGGSDTTITGEFSDNGIENNLSHKRGVISMARSSASNDSASSQFFIVQQDSTFLDGSYAAFGWVTDGMEIVDQICSEAEPTDSNGTIAAEDQPVITSIMIREAA